MASLAVTVCAVSIGGLPAGELRETVATILVTPPSVLALTTIQERSGTQSREVSKPCSRLYGRECKLGGPAARGRCRTESLRVVGESGQAHDSRLRGGKGGDGKLGIFYSRKDTQPTMQRAKKTGQVCGWPSGRRKARRVKGGRVGLASEQNALARWSVRRGNTTLYELGRQRRMPEDRRLECRSSCRKIEAMNDN